MKLLYCIPSLISSGGTERVLTNKVNYLASDLNNVIYIVLTEKQSGSPYYPLNDSVNVISLDIDCKSYKTSNIFCKAVLYLYKSFIYERKLSKLLFKIRPDITTTLLSNEIDFIFKIKDGSIKIAECHFNKDFRLSFVESFTSNRLKIAIAGWRNKQLARNVAKLNHLITLTHSDYECWKNVFSKSTIPNSLPFTSEVKSNCLSKKIIVAGRYTRQKGFDILLRVWQEIENLYPDWQLFIYGDGIERNELESYVLVNNLKNVYLEHSVSNIREKFVEGSFSILSSRFEGFGMVIIEAMECGLPVIAFDCQFGPNEIISHDVDGFLVPPNDLKALKENIQYLIEHEARRVEMGKMASLKASKYSNEIVMKKWIQLYKELI